MISLIFSCDGSHFMRYDILLDRKYIFPVRKRCMRKISPGTNLIDTGFPGFLADHPAGETGALKNRKHYWNQKDRYKP